MFHVKHLGQKMETRTFKRILLKLSGESFSLKGSAGLDFSSLEKIVDQLVVLSQTWEVALVLGGGNFIRGASLSSAGLSQSICDHLGMMGTILNGLALQACLEKRGISTKLFSRFEIDGITHSFFDTEKESYFGKGRIVIFSGGSGQPYFTTDTAAVLWALRSNCEIVLKGTQVDGAYSADPFKDEAAVFFTFLTYQEVLEKKLRFMDLTALTLAQENHMPFLIFNIHRPEGILKALRGEPPATWIAEAREGHG